MPIQADVAFMETPFTLDIFLSNFLADLKKAQENLDSPAEKEHFKKYIQAITLLQKEVGRTLGVAKFIKGDYHKEASKELAKLRQARKKELEAATPEKRQELEKQYRKECVDKLPDSIAKALFLLDDGQTIEEGIQFPPLSIETAADEQFGRLFLTYSNTLAANIKNFKTGIPFMKPQKMQGNILEFLIVPISMTLSSYETSKKPSIEDSSKPPATSVAKEKEPEKPLVEEPTVSASSQTMAAQPSKTSKKAAALLGRVDEPDKTVTALPESSSQPTTTPIQQAATEPKIEQEPTVTQPEIPTVPAEKSSDKLPDKPSIKAPSLVEHLRQKSPHIEGLIEGIQKTISALKEASSPPISEPVKEASTTSKPLAGKQSILTSVFASVQNIFTRKPKTGEKTASAETSAAADKSKPAELNPEEIQKKFDSFKKSVDDVLIFGLSQDLLSELTKNHEELLSSLPKDHLLREEVDNLYQKLNPAEILNIQVRNLSRQIDDIIADKSSDEEAVRKNITKLIELAEDLSKQQEIYAQLKLEMSDELKKMILDSSINIKNRIQAILMELIESAKDVELTSPKNKDYNSEFERLYSLLGVFTQQPFIDKPLSLPKAIQPDNFDTLLDQAVIKINQYKKGIERQVEQNGRQALEKVLIGATVKDLYSQTKDPSKISSKQLQLWDRKHDINFLQNLMNELNKNKDLSYVQKGQILRAAIHYLKGDDLRSTASTAGVNRFKEMLDGLKDQLIFMPEKTDAKAERELLNDFISKNQDVFAKNARAQKIIGKPIAKASTTVGFSHSLKKAPQLPPPSAANPTDPKIDPKPVPPEESGQKPSR